MKKFKLLSLVGITSIALTHAGWADGHGGGAEAALVVVTAEEASGRTREGSVVVTLEAAAEVESASAERASQVGFRTLVAEDPAPLHLRRVHQIVSLLFPVQSADR